MAFYYGIHNVVQYLMSAFGGKADMTIASQMSANDPKWTFNFLIIGHQWATSGHQCWWQKHRVIVSWIQLNWCGSMAPVRRVPAR